MAIDHDVLSLDEASADESITEECWLQPLESICLLSFGVLSVRDARRFQVESLSDVHHESKQDPLDTEHMMEQKNIHIPAYSHSFEQIRSH